MKPDVTDINVSYGVWPFQSFSKSNLKDLREHLTSQGVQHIFVSHLGSVFDLDTERYNRILIDDSAAVENCYPVPTVNPAVPGWRKQMDVFRSIADIRALKVYPSYHNVHLGSDEMNDVVSYASEYDLKLMIAIRLEDERTRYHGINVTGVPAGDVIEFCQSHSNVQPICLNAYLPEIREISSEVSNVYFDTSFADWFIIMEELKESVGLPQILFGSHSPFLTTGASLDKVRYSRLREEEKRMVLCDNAAQLFGLE